MKKSMFNRRKWKLPFSLCLLAFLGCSDNILETVNPNSITPATFWLTAEDAELGIIGAYSPITGVQSYGRMYVFNSDYRDDIVNGFLFSPRTAAGTFQGRDQPANRVVWQEAWKVVVRANDVLFNVPNIEMDDTQRNAILGEALFLRAFIYFDLVRTWRNVPLITTPLTIAEANSVFQAPPADVYQQIIDDLTDARSMLPSTRSGAELGRATWGAASALLGKVHMHLGQYDAAEIVLREVVNSGLYSLVENYADNFRSTTENNSESIFELQMLNDGNNGWGGDSPGTGRANSFIPDIAPQGFTNQNGMRINQWVLDLFLAERTVNDEVDPRAFVTLFWDTDETTTHAGEVFSSVTYGAQTYQEARPGDTNIYGNKYVGDDAEQGFAASNFHQSSSNFRVIRYADVLLLFAEAIIEGGAAPATAEAIDAINEVRERADLAPLANVTFQDIQDERVKELALEHIRWYDLLRWDLVVERIVNQTDIKSESGGVGSYQPGREFLSIPQRDLDINPNLQDNPSY